MIIRELLHPLATLLRHNDGQSLVKNVDRWKWSDRSYTPTEGLTTQHMPGLSDPLMNAKTTIVSCWGLFSLQVNYQK